MQFTTVRSKEKDYDIYLKSEKLVHSLQEWKKLVPTISSLTKIFPSFSLLGSGKNWFTACRSYKNVSQLFGSGKNYFEPDKHCCSQLEREKSGSLLFGDQIMQFTTVRSKEKDYDIYLISEKLVHSLQEHDKNVSQLFGSGKNWFLAISSLTNTVAAIWREKKVDPCYLETKKCSSQLLGARKKIMTSI